MYEYIKSTTADEHFGRLSLYTNDQFMRISKLVEEKNMTLETVCQDQVDHLWYLNDVLQSPIAPYIEDKLRHHILHDAVIPFLKNESVQMSVKIFFASQLVLVFTCTKLLDDILTYVLDEWISMDQIQQILRSGHETEVDAVLGLFYALLINRSVNHSHLAKLKLHRPVTIEDDNVSEDHCIRVFLDNDGSSIRVSFSEVDSNNNDNESSDEINSENLQWSEELLKLCVDPRMEKIVSIHMVLRILQELNISISEKNAHLLLPTFEQYRKEVQSKFESTDVADFINFLGLQYDKYQQLTRVKGDQLFGDPMLLIATPPDTLAPHSRPPYNDDEQLSRLLHIIVLWKELLPTPRDERELLRELCQLTPPQVEGSQVPLPPTTTIVFCAPYFEYRATRDHKNKRFAIIVDGGALYFIDTNGCPNGTGRITMAIPLLFAKVKPDGENKLMLRLSCIHKTSLTTSSQLCDDMIIFDDAQKCERVREAISKGIEEVKEDRRLALCKILDIPREE
jgi:hypothetical protein